MHQWPIHKEKAQKLAICIDIYSKIRDLPIKTQKRQFAHHRSKSTVAYSL